MKKSPACLALLLSIALVPHAQQARAQSSATDTVESNPAPVRKIVRVFTTSDDPTEIDVKNRQEVVIGSDRLDGRALFGGAFARKRGFLGVQLLDLTPELRSHFGAPPDAGVMVSKVLGDSPAATSGIQPGDIVLALEGQRVLSAVELERRVAPLDDLSEVSLEVLRDGTRRDLSVTIVERERPAIDLGRLALSAPGEIHGFEWHGPGEIERHVIRIDPEGLDDALRELEVRIENPDFVERFGGFGENRLELQRRIQELEERLQSLERQLEKFSGD